MNVPGDPYDDDLPGGGVNDDDLRAAEYVLGVLDADERHEVEARIARDGAFAARVEAWEGRFTAWLFRIVPTIPSGHVWPRVRTELGWPAVGTQRAVGRWNDVRTWRVATALAAAAAVGAISFALLQRPIAPVAPAPPPVVVAPPAPPPDDTAIARPVTVLERDDGSTGWIATLDVDGDKLHLMPVPVPPDAQGRVNELWIIPAGQAPISLGLVSNEDAHTVDIPAAVRGAMQVGATLAVTLEPEAGMPHAAPTGPIVAKGGIARL